ncbi:Angiotensin-converting enzyme [Nymphon striatum]|nr:Angiotensin-converting enzyme [Nymphon striatum]
MRSKQPFQKLSNHEPRPITITRSSSMPLETRVKILANWLILTKRVPRRWNIFSPPRRPPSWQPNRTQKYIKKKEKKNLKNGQKIKITGRDSLSVLPKLHDGLDLGANLLFKMFAFSKAYRTRVVCSGCKTSASQQVLPAVPWRPPQSLALTQGSNLSLFSYSQKLRVHVWVFPNINQLSLGISTGLHHSPSLIGSRDPRDEYHEKQAEIFLRDYEQKSMDQYRKEVTAEWNYDADLTKENEQIVLEVGEESAKFSLIKQEQVVKFDWSNFKNESIKRQLEFQSLKGMAALPKEKYSELQKIQSKMSGVYGKGKMSSFDGKKHDLRLDPDLTKIMGTSNDYDRLSHVWKGWRDAVGKPIRQDYIQYVNLKNEASVKNNFTDYSKYLIRNYESDTFVEDIEGLWLELKPLYEELHAFVRRKLRDQYGADKIKERGTIPAHILGNMWAQSWTNIFKFVTPYPKKQAIDVTEALVSKGYDALKMFKLSEDFFTGLGLEPMTKEFWSNSIITKPPGREMVCHGSAWDFGDKKDFRVKMCTVVTMVDLITVHHEMGHTQYYIQYANQPLIFREGANSGFHEAIGDTLALSVMTPEHLHKIGLLDSAVNDDETDINFLMNMALEKIAFLPFAYMMDRYRWDIFKGEIEFKNMNQRWWELREMYQGVSPPVERSENDFDPGAKYHIPNGVPYVRYFVSFIIQFQFHEALCRIAGHSGPLHRLKLCKWEIQDLGLKQWKKLTGQPKMSASSVMKYFKPLHDWLRKQNKGHKVGWILPSKENASKCHRPGAQRVELRRTRYQYLII